METPGPAAGTPEPTSPQTVAPQPPVHDLPSAPSQGLPSAPSHELPSAPSQGLPPARPTFRNRVDDHPIGLVLGVVVAAVTATLAVVVPLVQITQDNRVSAVENQMQQDRTAHAAAVAQLQAQLDDVRREASQQLADERARTQTRIDELDRSLASIHRSLGSDTQEYDVSKLVVDPADVSSLPATSTFFPEDRFYALDVAQSTGWTYEVASELKLTAEMLGVTEDTLRANATPAQITALTRFPVHVWRFGPDVSMTYVDPQSGRTTELHPRTQAWVQHVTLEDYLSFFQQTIPSPQPSGSTVAESFREAFRRDPAGWVLQDQVVSESAGTGVMRPRIDSLQKQDDLAYARVETIFPDVQSAGHHFGEYYWDREWLIVRAGQDLYMVKLFVADDDHRAPDYGALSSWLDQLRILGS